MSRSLSGGGDQRPSRSDVTEHFDEVAPSYDGWKRKAHLYYDAVKATVSETIPSGSDVMEVGCGTGDILAHLAPARGLGTDVSPEMVRLASKKYPDLRFAVHDITSDPLPERFTFVLSVDVAEHVGDLRAALAGMAAMLESNGRVVLLTPNPGWGPVLHLAERLKLKMPEGEHTWRHYDDVVAAAGSANLQLVDFRRTFLVPRAVPLLNRLDSAGWAERVRGSYGLIQRFVFEPAK